MCVYDETNEALFDFIEDYCICAFCEFWTPELIGGVCNAPEYTIGHLEDDTSSCEQHKFKNKELDKQLSVLVEKNYNAWFIVHGFLYCDTPEGIFNG